LVDPITLPCGYSVCKRHLDDLLENTPTEMNKFECQLCKKKHSIPEDGFAINKRIQNALNIKLSTLKLNPVYEECKTEINEAKMNIQMIESLDKDPENFIYEFFEELKRQVDLRREKLKLEIDNNSDEIIQSIESAKDNCIKLSTESKRLNTEIENSKNEVTELTDDFDTFEIDNEKFEDIRKHLTILNGNLSRKLSEYKDSIIGGKEYTFEFKEIDIKSLFGSFKETEKVISFFIYPYFKFFVNYIFEKAFESTIMGPCLQNKLLELCEFSKDQKLELKYRASRDGFSSSDFHSHCDGIANTLTVIKANSGNIFGGFTEQKWHSRGGFVTDPNAFIFSLVNKEEKPFKVLCSNEGKEAIGCDSADKAKNILAGSDNFETIEIEVYAKTI